MRVADERTLHVVDAEAVDHAVLYNRMRLVSHPGQKFFAAGVGSVHVAVEHQVLAASSTGPASDNIGTAFFDLLPRDIQPKLLKCTLHVVRHLQFLAGGAGNVDDVAAHGDDLFFPHLCKDSLGQLWVKSECLSFAGGVQSCQFSVLSSQFSVANN